MTLRERLRAAARHEAGGPVRGLWRTAAASQLGLVGVWDRATPLRVRSDRREEVARRVTITVKTFERPSILGRFVRTARRVFDGRIVVADDSRRPATSGDPRVEVIALPFNSGVAVGRNAALDAVDTEFVFVADDDLVFTAASNLAEAMDHLDLHPEVDVVGFIRIELPRWYFLDHGEQGLLARPRAPLRPLGEQIDECTVEYKIEQAYLARTASIQRVRWDERIRMVDHADFFTRALGELVVVLDRRLRVYHARTPFDGFYAAHREDVAADLAYLSGKWAGGGPPAQP